MLFRLLFRSKHHFSPSNVTIFGEYLPMDDIDARGEILSPRSERVAGRLVNGEIALLSVGINQM